MTILLRIKITFTFDHCDKDYFQQQEDFIGQRVLRPIHSR